jgi:hypothetical protein
MPTRLAAATIEDAPHGARCRDLPCVARVVHEEAQPITLERGPWLVVRKPGYSPEAIRRVLTVDLFLQLVYTIP